MTQAIDIHRPIAELTRTGLELKQLSTSWVNKPRGKLFIEALIGFLGSKDNKNTRRSYSFAILDFFAWYDSNFHRLPTPDEVRRADGFAYVQYLQTRTIGLDEYRLAHDPERALDLSIYRYIAEHSSSRISAIRRHLLSEYRFTTSVTFTAGGHTQTLRVLEIEADEPRGDALDDFVVEHGRTPPNPLDLRLGCLCQHNLLTRTPTISEIRSGLIEIDVGDEHQNQAQIGYRVDPETFQYSLATSSAASKSTERVSTVLLRIGALSSFWRYLSETGENKGDTDALLRYNVWAAPAKDLRKKLASHQQVARELATPDRELFLRVLAQTFTTSHPGQSLEAASAYLEGADVSGAAAAQASLYDLRDRAALMLIYWTGLRAGEMEKLRRNDLTTTTKGAILDVLGKGSLRRIVTVPNEALRAIDALQSHLEELSEAASKRPNALCHRLTSEQAPLIPPVNKWGRAASNVDPRDITGLSDSSLSQVLHGLGRRAGITRDSADYAKLHPHGLRHLAATEARKRGVDLPTIQATLGHRSLASTGLYVEVRDAYDRTLSVKRGPIVVDVSSVVTSALEKTATTPTAPPVVDPPPVTTKRVRSALVFAEQLQPSAAAKELASESSAVATLLDIYKNNWGEKAKRTAIIDGGKGPLAHAYVGKSSGLPWWTGATGNMSDPSFSYTPNGAFPAMPIVSPWQFLGEEGSSVCSEPLCKAMSELYDAWFDDPEKGPTAASALSQWLFTSSAITVEVDDVLRKRHGGWVDFERPLQDTTFDGRPTTLRQHLDDAILTWFKHSGWQFRPTTETRIPQGGELEIPIWYGEADPLQSLPERERLELLDWLQVLVGLPPKDTTDRFNGVSRSDLGKLLSDICSYETTAADIELGDSEKHEYLSAIDDQIQKRVSTLTKGRTTTFRYSESKSGRKTDKMRSELQKKIAKREERDDTTERAGRGLGPYMMATLGELFGESVETDQVLNLFAMCTSGAPLKDVADKYKSLFRVVAGSIYHTNEFKAAFAKETGQHSECVARRLARHIYEEGRLEQWYKRRNWPDTTIPYLEAMSAYRIPCPTSQEHELRGLVGAGSMPLYEVWRQAKGRLLGAMEPEDDMSDIEAVRTDETSRRVARATPKASDLTANPRSPLHKRIQSARRFLPNPMDILAIIFGIKRGRK